MINLNMRSYDYFTLGNRNEYGQQQLSDIKGSVKMAISNTSTNIQDNINYKDAAYIGLTYDANINDTYVIEYGAEKLKVLYVNAQGRMKQVFLGVYFG